MNQSSQRIEPPIIVDTQDGLVRLIDDLLHQRHVAIDTESNSLYVYQERVCLIQLSTSTDDYLVDPLGLDDLSPLGTLMAEPRVEKIFHAAEYDIMCLRRDFDFEFASLFDTLVSVRILGWERIGLASILEGEFGVKASKRYQRADWGARPLSKEMVRYAQMDTHYLIPLRERLHTELERAGHMEEAHEAFDELLSIGAHASPFNPNGFWSINGISNLAPRQKAILRELYLFRERAAQERDRPPFKVMSDSVLLRLAEREPSALGAIRNIPGMSNGQVHRYGEGILGCIRHGRTAKAPPRPPRPPRPDQGLLARYDALRNWRKQRARKRGVESDVIVSKDVLWKLAKVYPRTPEQLAAVKDLGPWKRKTYGDEILRVLGQAGGTS
jgi:ribonuclease D